MGIHSEIPSRNSAVPSVRSQRRHFWHQMSQEPSLGFKPTSLWLPESAVQHSTHRASRVLWRRGRQSLTWCLPQNITQYESSIMSLSKIFTKSTVSPFNFTPGFHCDRIAKVWYWSIDMICLENAKNVADLGGRCDQVKLLLSSQMQRLL